jgi:integrase
LLSHQEITTVATTESGLSAKPVTIILRSRTMKSPRRKTRSDKFPSTLHPTGQYCKKINGKLHYFGTNKKQAFERYLEQATYLHGGQNIVQKASNGSMTLKGLCDLYLEYKHSKVLAGDLSATHHNDQIGSLSKLMSFLGKGRRIKSISTLDLQNYKRGLQSAYGSAHRLNLHVGAMKAMFHWARRNDILQHIPNIDAVSRGKIVHQEMYIFSSEQIKKLLSLTSTKVRAMILLGLNCGFGCTDCARLKWTDLDLENGRVQLARNKTGVPRNLPLWPETIQALKKVPRSGQLVFYTAEGHPWVRASPKTMTDGSRRYTTVNAVASMFSRLLKKARINAPNGTGFYTLRRTAATLAARSGDPFAVQRLLGHVDLTMATRYVQDVSEQTDRVIENSRKYVIQGNT